jgi:hypothetical protein
VDGEHDGFYGTFDGTSDEGVYINEQEYLEDRTFLNLTNGKMILIKCS